MSRIKTQVAVVGGGIVGLAIAAQLARAGTRVALLERRSQLATETSARNSGVIHAGLYYEPGSLKARTCIRGGVLLYERCVKLGIPHRRTGKLVLAVDDSELGALDSLTHRGLANGAAGLTLWTATELTSREPTLRARAALHSPETGIVDAHALAMSLANEARANGADVVLHSEVRAVTPSRHGFNVAIDTAGDRIVLETAHLVNAAGLASDVIGASLGLDIDRLGLRVHWNKGDYFVIANAAPRPHTPLVYPLPTKHGLGVHLTTDLAGTLRAGPDTEWIDEPNYRVDERKAAAFGAAVRRYLPGLRDEHLSADYAGIRPKLLRVDRDGAAPDFVIMECSAHGLPGYVHLAGIESPGLTASLAIAEEVARCLGPVP